jgi:1-pyrroline-4-hydroxy-2-carboxylate deaminase
MAHFPGVYVATTTPFRPGDHALDLDTYREHCRWLVDRGVHGLVPVGSLGEYESLDPEERRAVVEAAVEAAEGQVPVVPGVSAPSGVHARRWAEHAAEAGAAGVMCLPPVIHNATEEEIVAHFAEVGRAGLPIIAYNNPFSTKIDLGPRLLARLAAEIEQVVAVKEFSGDVRRVSEIIEVAPDIEVLCGADDIALESALMGATGWIGGFTGVFPEATVRVFEAGREGRLHDVLGLYRALLPVLRWDTTPKFVQAIKLAQDMVGQAGGPSRSPRLPLADADAGAVKAGMQRALEAID